MSGIIGATPRECFRTFREFASGLVASIIPSTVPLRVLEFKDRKSGLALADMVFAQRVREPVAIDTNLGRLFFYAWQLLGTERLDATKHRLTTLKYAYQLLASNELGTEPLIRWEFDREQRPDKSRPPRFHVQMDGHLGADDLLSLKKLHTPTGRVLIEDVLRFLVYDLGVKPVCGKKWPEMLHRSERRYYQEFMTKE